MAAHMEPRAGVRSGPLHRFVAPPLMLLALGLFTVGCATKGYVKKSVAESEARTDASLNVVRSDLTETRTVADQAMEKATLAEKLAYWRDNPGSLGVDRKHLTKNVVVPHEKDGSQAGVQTYHRDGRIDALVTPKHQAHNLGATT